MKNLNEENEMEGATTLTDVAKSDYIRTGGLGSDYWYGGRWASDSTNQHTNNFNRETTRSENSCNRTLFGQAFNTIKDQFENQTRTSEFNRVCDRLAGLGLEIRDNSIASERRADDKIAALAAKVDAGFGEIITRELADTKAENIALQAKLDNREQTINNFCCPKPAVCVDPCCNGGGGGNGDSTTIILQAQAQQFQAMQQTMTAGFTAIAEAIRSIDVKPGANGSGK